MLKVVDDSAQPNSASGSMRDEIVRDGARQMLAAALQAEVATFIDAHRGDVDDAGRRLVVRNGYHRAAGGDHGSRCGRGSAAAGQ